MLACVVELEGVETSGMAEPACESTTGVIRVSPTGITMRSPPLTFLHTHDTVGLCIAYRVTTSMTLLYSSAGDLKLLRRSGTL